jgi:hypothetical protein
MRSRPRGQIQLCRIFGLILAKFRFLTSTNQDLPRLETRNYALNRLRIARF